MSNTLKLGNGKWATGKDTLLSFSDTNNNYKPLPFSFSRDSSGTVVNKDGLIETVGSGEPRIDFKDNTKGALLLEPSRGNLVLTSASGTYGNSPASEENTISPDSTNNAVIPTIDHIANRYQYIISGGTYSTNTKLTYSWYRKRISTPMVDTYLGDLRPSGVNLSYVGDTKQIESNINGYDRFEAVLNITDGSATTTVRMYFGDVIGVGNSSIAYWGHQLEVGSYPTSYIPTSGSAVTRVKDSSSQTVPSGVIGQTEGTMFFNADIQKFNDSSFYIGISNGNSLNSAIYMYQPSNGNLSVLVRNSGDNELIISNANWSVGFNKIAITYTTTSLKLFINGVIKGSISFTGLPPFTKLTLGSRPDSGNLVPKVEYKEVKLYNTTLTDQELIALTTI